MIGLHGSLKPSSVTGVYPNNQNLPLPRAASPHGPYSNYEMSPPLRDNAGRFGTYAATPGGDIETFSNSGVWGPYGRFNIDRNMGLPGAFRDPYMSGREEPSPVGNADYNTHGGSYSAIGGPWHDPHASRTSGAAFRTPAPTTHGSCTLLLFLFCSYMSFNYWYNYFLFLLHLRSSFTLWNTKF